MYIYIYLDMFKSIYLYLNIYIERYIYRYIYICCLIVSQSTGNSGHISQHFDEGLVHPPSWDVNGCVLPRVTTTKIAGTSKVQRGAPKRNR